MRSQNYIQSVPPQPFGHEHATSGGIPTAVGVMRELIAALTTAVEATETIAAREVAFVGNGVDFFAEVSRFEVQMITQALRLARGSQVKAARLLGLNPTTLNSKIKTLNISWKVDEVQPGANWREVSQEIDSAPEQE
jgi:DNA-binding NtrC family response regulator